MKVPELKGGQMITILYLIGIVVICCIQSPRQSRNSKNFGCKKRGRGKK